MTAASATAGLSAEMEDPIWAELFSIERLEQHAESLAAAQQITKSPTEGKPLLDRVVENGRLLQEYYTEIVGSAKQQQPITPAAEWLVDNFYVVEEQLREIRDDLPPGFYQRLPKLAAGHLEGYPRVYGVAWAFVAHTDSRFDPDVLKHFITAYQRVQPLSIGELWGVAITLRIVLVENLRRLAAHITLSRRARDEADRLADGLLGVGTEPPASPASALRQFEKKPLDRGFVVQLLQRLRDLDPKVGPILLWLDDRLAEQGTTPDEMVRTEHQQQAATNVTVRNIITSMRLMSSFDWHVFFEDVSLVDGILRGGSNFGQLDFATRDAYRHAIEDMSRGSDLSEVQVTERLIRFAREGAAATTDHAQPAQTGARSSDPRYTDPGYYLISDGSRAFEREIGFRLPARHWFLWLYGRMAAPAYLGSIALLTATILALPLWRSERLGAGALQLALLGLLAAVPASDLAIALVNRGVTDLFKPRKLARLNLKAGVPPDMRTIIVIPTLFSSAQGIREQVERLEIHYLANSDGDLRFALLSDWMDANTEHLPNDDELLNVAVEAIAALNQRHGAAPGGDQRFTVLHRRRLWNEAEGKWMGWERKRGKLHELNWLLRGASGTTFLPIDGKMPQLAPGIRYVITLDADTRLPRGAAARLVGAIAHPLNQPRFSAEQGRVVEGYGIIQPRITPALPTDSGGSRFQKIFAGPCGIDPYSAAVSDVYQDLFGEGSYTGKGIYDVDAFEAALAGKVPDNTLLSHDLFEGIFARTALVTDIELFDEFPSHYETNAARQHRWARGDWQLLPWIVKGTAGAAGGAGVSKAKIPVMGRWKMADNLRRSLSAPCLLLVLLAGWLMRFPLLWTQFVLATIAIPTLLPFLAGLNSRLEGISKRSHFRDMASDLVLGLLQAGLTITFLAYQAWLMADAIVRTLVRLWITRKRMLEWVTAAQANSRANLNLYEFFVRMIGGVILAVATLVIVWVGHHQALPIALPFVLVWLAAPEIAWWISLPPQPAVEGLLSPANKIYLRETARRTWRFFEEVVTSGDHFLPPDNFQETPMPVLAHRTSPTNIGLYLLSTVAAHDFGWLGTFETAERLEATLETISRMEHFRGHLYNWYDTRDLRPLDPKYISSVDSGNLAGQLLVIASACREMIRQPLDDALLLMGLGDCLGLLRKALTDAIEEPRAPRAQLRQLSRAVEAIEAAIRFPGRDAIDRSQKAAELPALANSMVEMATRLPAGPGDTASAELRMWTQAIKACVDSHPRDAPLTLPWFQPDGGSSNANAIAITRESVEWRVVEPFFRAPLSLANIPDRFEKASRALLKWQESSAEGLQGTGDEAGRVDALIAEISASAAEATALQRRLLDIAQRSEEMFEAMDFSFLLDDSRKLLSIGYRGSDGMLDPNCYDLLASEARLASFIAISKGDIPQTHWFRLARALTPAGKGSALISWSGSMFEYLMPALVMQSPTNSLLGQTYHQVVLRQIDYGTERGVPWGISESAFSARDIDFTYQYCSFGVPGLGLKRGLSEDLVIAPYATALASIINPAAAAQNLHRITAQGGLGALGFYDALDYTGSRLPKGKSVEVVRTFMAHHQGMFLVALANTVNNNSMCNRFHATPIVQATELLLQERTPRDVLVARPRAEEVSVSEQVREFVPPPVRRFTNARTAMPRTNILSNGRYAVMLTAAGSGYSRWRNIAITRWREDATRDCWGSYFFLRDEQTGAVWSAGYQPNLLEPDAYEAAFFEDHVEFSRRDRSLVTAMDVLVSSEDDAEMRRVSITNAGMLTRQIQVTSYAELVLAAQATDAAHPAFSNLFVETEFVPEVGVLLATRRKRSSDEPSIWAAHVLVVDDEFAGELEYETDRARFIGRARSLQNPLSVIDGRPLSGTTGAVLDPILSLRRTVRVPPGKTVHLIFSTLVAATREEALDLADKYRDARIMERTRTLAWTQAQVQLRHLGVMAEEAHLFQQLANAVLYSDAALRPDSDVLSRTRLERTALWSQGISGDVPIILARINDSDDIDLVRQLLRAHEYMRLKQLSADVVIINEKAPSYVQELQNSLEALVHASQLRLSPDSSEASGKIYLLRADLISAETSAQLQAAARAVLLGRRGTLFEQMNRVRHAESEAPEVPRFLRARKYPDLALPRPPLQFFNGLGGFASDGREYVVVLGNGLRTPEPWINVIANPDFGFLASESGSGFTWSLNSHENQITPWSNDHVMDPAGEAIYLRDEGSGEVWTPTALPIRDEDSTYVTRHGQGYSRYSHGSHGILVELTQFVPARDPVKISQLVLQNDSGRPRRISVTAYVEWVLGSSRAASAPYLITEKDTQTGAVLARNAWGGDFGGRISFADLGGKQTSLTGDRAEFLGRNGSAERPVALETGKPLSGKVGAGLDPCAALQTTISLPPGARVELRFLLGQTENKEKARDLINRYRAADLEKVLREVTSKWDEILGALQVKTPDPAMDVMLNRWVLYQTLSSRYWARAAFYQLSGAYGFRDQLQDVLALAAARPEITREHLLRSAAHQFPEGDVQHWWHPPARGIRTRMSDDLLWLPYAVTHYLEVTGETAVLDEPVAFLEGPVLAEGQLESYFEAHPSEEKASLFEHCARALDRSLKTGSHGLPLMGTGDWNDGMNRVGVEGKGESVWLAWFLHTVLWEFSKIADARGERKRAEVWRVHVSVLKAALESEGWDGEWYRRAYYDDGTPLGSMLNSECSIDAIAQSWGIMSGAAELARGARAMDAVDRMLILRPAGLVLLLTPPFNHSNKDPGYIKGYVPGIRENGGQYTHASVWTLIAFAAMGDGDKAMELFTMMNPIRRSDSFGPAQLYKVEPYVLAGDIYAEAPHVGRGGWTWYTGSAGWLYRAGTEWLLGLRIRNNALCVDPCIPKSWKDYSMTFRYRSAMYEIRVENPSGVTHGVSFTEVDGNKISGVAQIPLVNDGTTHRVRVVLG